MLQRWFLCTRCAGRDKDRLPATGQIHPRLLPPSALHWKRSLIISLEPRGFEVRIAAVQSQIQKAVVVH
jgi:hypothetical protein